MNQNNQSYAQMVKNIMESPWSSYALRSAVQEFDRRDVLDALRDAETLVMLLNKKWEEATK